MAQLLGIWMSPNAELSFLCHIPHRPSLGQIAGRLGLKYSINTISVSQYLVAKLCKMESFIRSVKSSHLCLVAASPQSSVPNYFKAICFSSCLLDEGKDVHYVHALIVHTCCVQTPQSITPPASPTLGDRMSVLYVSLLLFPG